MLDDDVIMILLYMFMELFLFDFAVQRWRSSIPIGPLYYADYWGPYTHRWGKLAVGISLVSWKLRSFEFESLKPNLENGYVLPCAVELGNYIYIWPLKVKFRLDLFHLYLKGLFIKAIFIWPLGPSKVEQTNIVFSLNI